MKQYNLREYLELVEAETSARLQRAEKLGFTLRLYHKSAADFDHFAPYSHFGTHHQASMRAVGNGARIYPVLVRARKLKRMREAPNGSWDLRKLKAIERQGYDGVVYLNRYEGIPLDEFQALWDQGIDPDSLSDAQFKKLVPSAQDSYIIFDPSNVRSINAAFGTSIGKSMMD